MSPSETRPRVYLNLFTITANPYEHICQILYILYVTLFRSFLSIPPCNHDRDIFVCTNVPYSLNKYSLLMWGQRQFPLKHTTKKQVLKATHKEGVKSQITGVSTVYSIVCSGADQRLHQSSASLAFVRGIHRWPANSYRIGSVTAKMFPIDDVITQTYHKTSNIRRTLVCNKIVDHSYVVGASPVGAAPTTSSFSTWHLASGGSAKTGTIQYDNLLRVGIWYVLY